MVPKQVKERIVEIKSQSKAANATGSARTESRKARRQLAKLAAEPRAPVLMEPLGKKPRLRPHQALLGARASAKLETEEARRYFDSLIVPENGSAQFPDLSEFPTIPISSHYVTSVPLSQDSVSNSVFTLAAFFPNLSVAQTQPTGIVSGSITWGTGNAHPRYTTYHSNFCEYRTISMAVRVINSTNLNLKAGIVYQDLVSSNDPDEAGTLDAQLPTTVGSITQSPTMKMGTFSQEYLEDVPRAGWIPLNLNAYEFTEMDSDNGVTSPMTPAIVILIDHQTETLSEAQSVLFEVWYNFEAVPLFSTQSLFDTRMCIGSPERIAAGLLENRSKLVSGITASVKDFQKTVGSLSEFGRVTNDAMNLFGSLAATVGYRNSEKKSFGVNRIFGLLREFIPAEISKCSSDRKDVDSVLAALATIQKLINIPDFPKRLVVDPVYLKSGPWKKDLISLRVRSTTDLAEEDDGSIVSHAHPPSLKSVKPLPTR